MFVQRFYIVCCCVFSHFGVVVGASLFFHNEMIRVRAREFHKRAQKRDQSIDKFQEFIICVCTLLGYLLLFEIGSVVKENPTFSQIELL